ncbi:alpha-amylase family glycosyl hydrolase [Cryobacterium sp. SO2]|uniref:alpha-amylase family glycosyl hydrolase n=1 Tax=Cryobacterium sp. SO2 TaxID=1897060 RepID=UPI00223E7599|nr:alpha-amylase family glycosyl hydrolase [Cryobacterium sp. SO2]WEO78038.1 alpha-amylase family glycosyl hydrolase [Cryobacterium sp. SO2]
MPDWTEHVIWWHVYPLGFVGADTTGVDRAPTHRLRMLEPWLDYLLELGANGLALGPVFTSRTHGYDTTDYFEVDPRLGDTADLEHLISECHRRGIKVMLDGVFNHVGRDFGPLVTALADPAAPENALFRRTPAGELLAFEGHDALVTLNHDNPAVAELVTAVLTHWLDLGADAWRLDAAYAIPATFWAGVLPGVRERHPEVYVMGEVLHGDYAGFVAASGVDTVTQYELWQAIWHGIAERNFFELDWALTRHTAFLGAFVPYTFVGNHDVSRLASQIPDARHHAHALVLLLTLGGTPAIYYGDERGLRAVKEQRAGGDDAIRPAYPATPADLPPGDQDPIGAATFVLHQELIGLRRRHPWLHRATSRPLDLTNTGYVLEVTDGIHRLIVALNLGDEALSAATDGARRLAGTADTIPTGHAVPAHGWAIFG